MPSLDSPTILTTSWAIELDILLLIFTWSIRYASLELASVSDLYSLFSLVTALFKTFEFTTFMSFRT